jgi:ATP-dependent DNA helicase DinG
VEGVLGPHGVLAAALPGYEHRPTQLAMAHAVAEALADESPLLVEAGTGTGKTLAYLVPAILSGKRVVVSTATRTLQEQIWQKDLPFLREHIGVEVDAAVLKGISNYLCRRKLAELGDVTDPSLVRILEWARRTESGDVAELTTVPEDDPAWRLATTTPDARIGPRCPHFTRCFVTLARRAAARARVVIVNHHLFFADLSLRHTVPGAQVLPEYDAVIFDEAHALEEVATEHFGITVSTLRLGALLRDARRTLVESLLGRSSGPVVARVETAGDALFHALRGRLVTSGPLFQQDDARTLSPDDLFATPVIQEAWFRFDAALEELSAHAKQRAALEADAEPIAAVARRAELLRTDLATIADPPPTSRAVRWADVKGRLVALHASPVDVGALLREHVFQRVGAAVLTSATLTSDGSFGFVRDRLGATDELGTRELAVASPFDFGKQALLYLPRDLPAPDETGFLDAFRQRTKELLALTEGRAFLLFTSWRSLRAVASVLPDEVPWPVLVQGTEPRAALLARFREKPGSVLLATQSFWEGVDVPGDALSLVVVEKLPFSPPDEPLAQARAARLEERGEDPFLRYHLPRAALTLKQGFGRLIRRRDDRGIVAILDHRILSRQYGRVFLSTLPPAGRTSALEQVRRWWYTEKR